MNKFNNHAGHGKQDSKSCGAYKIVKESIENRLLSKEVEMLLKKEGKTVYDCTVDYPDSKSDCLNKIVAKCNANKVDLDISHHLNSGRNDLNGDGSIGGVEVWVSSKTSKAYDPAVRVCKELEKLGFKNRGVKVQPSYTIIAKTNAPAMIIEYFFVDDKDDCNLYQKLGYKALAKAVVQGILNKKIAEPSTSDTINNHVNGKFVNGSYEGKTAKVTASSLNVRYDRGTQYNIVGSLPKGSIVKLNYCLNGWISIEGFKGNKGLGYVSTDYLQLI